jgi:flagellar M-ring protein FliF
MAKLNIKFIDQAKELFKRLKLWQKALFIGVPSFFLIGFIILLVAGNPEANKDYKVLYSDLESDDAGKIIESLDEQKIKYKLEDGGTTILVKEDAVYQTRNKLAAQGLPESSTVGYELFDKTNLGMSEFVQELNYRRALEGELARTISSLDEVKKARVHIVIPKTELFEKDQKNPSASVTLFVDKSIKMKMAQIEGIQTLVASSIEGMIPEQVSVVDQMGKLLSEVPIDENSVAGRTALQLEQQRRLEKQLETKVQSMLDGVIGVDNSKVTVTADLDFTRINRTQTRYDPEEQVARSEQNISEISSTADSLSYPNFSEDRDEQNQIANYEISNTVSTIEEQIGEIENLSIAVMINQKEVIVTGEDGLRRKDYAPRSDSTMQKIHDVVVNAVGFNENRGDQISVVQVPFETLLDYDIDELNPKPWYQQEYYQRLIAVLAIMLIVILIMVALLQSKIVKDRVRLAMELPENVQLVSDDVLRDEEDEEDEAFEEEEAIIEDDIMMLPQDLPEAMLQEPEHLTMFEEEDEPSDELDLQPSQYEQTEMGEEITENQIMNQEVKKQIEDFCNEHPEDAVKLLRIFIQEDIDKQVKLYN